MTALKSTVARLFGRFAAEVPGAPRAEFTFAPTTAEETAAILDFAAEHRLTVLPWGAGTHRIGESWVPDVLLSTRSLGGIDWRPDDLTVVVGAGVTVADLEARMADRRQTAVLPENPGPATVGGVVAAAASGWRRLRFGPTRDRMLEVVAATGDGRVIRGGGQVVKNVSGYDLPRLFTGSRGSLGVITRVCLKLWPQGSAAATIAVDDAERAGAVIHRPLAVLQTPGGVAVYLTGTAAEVEAQAATLGGSPTEGLVWPDRPHGPVEISLRVPPARIGEAVALVAAAGFVAAHGVGEVLAAGSFGAAEVSGWRVWAESVGGGLVVATAPEGFGVDPWGMAPPSLPLQRRIKAAFDPVGIMVPGRLPGGL
ncbi:MAG: FAD-binding oxidoreductase [Acidimicrobiia bacterium]|nr:FAD-binding oxidoreductase [Acidimicrobiia bacterium]